jgi:antitoxin VapB
MMALSLKDAETDRLARKVAARTGESLTAAVRTALSERLQRPSGQPGDPPDLAAQLHEIAVQFAALPDLDRRTADKIIGYDENGMW